ncbi:hypothetical protein BpHYR1_022123 [Brachionus plicatilis]|uniref:Uncharacterized protein n=1 Tax=Brachionus plicatilis TaxID=10195 RepID=A0A3M7SF16_BRAPC|nr:hypothetical protein BpHYR1_022123 [Brachionus plicatilis]
MASLFSLYTKAELSKYNFIIIPTCFMNHWRLIFLDFSKSTIILYDSLGINSNTYYQEDLNLIIDNWCYSNVSFPIQTKPL